MTHIPQASIEGQTDKIEVFVNDKIFSGWTTASVRRSLDEAVSQFQMTIRLWNNEVITPMSPCRIYVGGHLVINGYVDGSGRQRSVTTRTVMVKGRSKTCDVVDCSARPQKLDDVSLLQAATYLAKPYNVFVKAEGTIPTVKRVRVQPSESAYHAIERAARSGFVLITDTELGELLLTTAGASGNNGDDRPIVVGKNVLNSNVVTDWSGRFSEYTVHGHGASGGDVFHRQVGVFVDEHVPRYRNLLLLSGSQQPGVSAKNRAEWERQARIGQATTAQYTVQGWREPGGSIWRPNTMASVWDPDEGWAGLPLLITSVEFTISERGATTTSLTLKPRQGYESVETARERIRKAGRRSTRRSIEMPEANQRRWLDTKQLEELD